MQRFILWLAICWFIIFSHPVTAAIVNGSFESGDLSGWWYDSNAVYKVGRAVAGSAADGNYYADMSFIRNSGPDYLPTYSTLGQNFEANVGDRLSFSYQYSPVGPPNDPYLYRGFRVLLDNNIIFDTNQATTSWKSFSYSVPSNGNHTLAFQSMIVPPNDGRNDLYIDNVKLKTTPPKTYAILVGSRSPGFNKDGTEIPDAIRGDLDVDHMAAALSWADEIHKVKVDFNDSVDIKSNIDTLVAGILPKIRSCDQLIFYYSGHGDGGSQAGKEETLDPFGSGQTISDNWLTSTLAYKELENVKKVVLLDSCHSGGFLTHDGYDGDLDLQDLKNVALLAAAKEDGTSGSNPITGTGYFTDALAGVMTTVTTFADLASKLASAYTGTLDGYFKDQGYGTIVCDSSTYFSPDFDPNSRLDGQVPEPSTLALLAMGGIGLIAYGWRRRKA